MGSEWSFAVMMIAFAIAGAIIPTAKAWFAHPRAHGKDRKGHRSGSAAVEIRSDSRPRIFRSLDFGLPHCVFRRNLTGLYSGHDNHSVASSPHTCSAGAELDPKRIFPPLACWKAIRVHHDRSSIAGLRTAVCAVGHGSVGRGPTKRRPWPNSRPRGSTRPVRWRWPWRPIWPRSCAKNSS